MNTQELKKFKFIHTVNLSFLWDSEDPQMDEFLDQLVSDGHDLKLVNKSDNSDFYDLYINNLDSRKIESLAVNFGITSKVIYNTKLNPTYKGL